jgi:hypothetical protein
MIGSRSAVVLACVYAFAGAADPPRVLFIGNSLTAANNLPGIVEAMSGALGQPIRCESVAFGGFSLEDHWNDGRARRAIARGGWSTVVLQQGPSALPESRVLLIEYTRKFDAEIRRMGARTALYMVWPTAARRSDFEGVNTSYAAAARAVGGLFLPVGEAFRAVRALDSRVGIYGPDGFHPAPPGSYLAALVIVQALTGRSVDNAPATISIAGPPASRIDIPERDAAILKRAAAQTVERFRPTK